MKAWTEQATRLVKSQTADMDLAVSGLHRSQKLFYKFHLVLCVWAAVYMLHVKDSCHFFHISLEFLFMNKTFFLH